MSAENIRILREETGAGMLDCKKALAEAGGDIGKATEILRKRGAAVMAKKAGRVASEGLLGFAASADGKTAVLVELNCETDFVARNPDFIAFVEAAAAAALKDGPKDAEALASLPKSSGGTFAAALETLTGKIGEKLSFRRLVRMSASGAGEYLATYLHAGNRIGVLLRASAEGESGKDPAALNAFLKDAAMHIAAMAPPYLKAEDIPAARVEKEKEIILAQLAQEGKPEEMREKISQGKLAKFRKDFNLLDQIFVKDPSGKQSVADWMKSHFPGLRLVEFVRYQVGEGMEKKADNFAEEVARQVAASGRG